jgi:hypothetical protein
MNCKELDNSIQSLANKIALDEIFVLKDQRIKPALADRRKLLEERKKQYIQSDCDLVLGDEKIKQTLGLAEKFQAIDKDRIQPEIDVLVKKRIFFGTVILLGALVIIVSIKKK